ncbi:MAG TPA: VWA domain-containing protein [Pyrinomonadaceae bacterium]|nr:VWA domain-containing protein [Pyrinomonadaceae bacterium]
MSFKDARRAVPQRFARPRAPILKLLAGMTLPLLLFVVAGAQQKQGGRGGGVRTETDETIRVETNLVNLHVRVVDELNRPLMDVRREEFSVFEDGVAQEIAFFSRDEAPLTYGLVIANTSFARAQLGMFIGMSKTIIEGNRAGDETFLARFRPERRASIEWRFTPDKAALFNALDELQTETRATALYDGIYLSAAHIAEQSDAAGTRGGHLPRRRALILVTDGEDRGSHYTQAELFEQLRAEDVQLYIVGFVKETDSVAATHRREGAPEPPRALLERLARETGGRAFFPRAVTELPRIAQEITRDLRTQYTIGYSPTNKARDGTFRRVHVVLAPGAAEEQRRRRVVVRDGYKATRGARN